jgi:hypothetical protein
MDASYCRVHIINPLLYKVHAEFLIAYKCMHGIGCNNVYLNQFSFKITPYETKLYRIITDELIIHVLSVF